MWPFSKKNKKTEKPTNVYLGNPRSGRSNQSTANPRRTQLNDSDISTTHGQQAATYTWGTQSLYNDDTSSRHSSHGHHDSSSSSYDSGSHHSSGSDSSSYSSGSDSSSSGSDSGSW